MRPIIYYPSLAKDFGEERTVDGGVREKIAGDEKTCIQAQGRKTGSTVNCSSAAASTAAIRAADAVHHRERQGDDGRRIVARGAQTMACPHHGVTAGTPDHTDDKTWPDTTATDRPA